jgi:small subunit ribosomal protein S17
MIERGQRKVLEGIVVKAAKDKTATVAIVRRVPHKLYKKIIRRTKKVLVHDEDYKCNVGDVIRIMETRPLSKTKRWRYVETIRSAGKLEDVELIDEVAILQIEKPPKMEVEEVHDVEETISEVSVDEEKPSESDVAEEQKD